MEPIDLYYLVLYLMIGAIGVVALINNHNHRKDREK